MVEIFEYRHLIAVEDIDELGHAGNYHYVKWLQFAAIAHSSANGWPPERYDELGAGWVVRSHDIVYLKPAFEGEIVVIKTWVANMKPATSLRKYEVLNKEGDLLAKAETDWAFVKRQSQRPIRIPQQVSECFSVLPKPQ